MSEAVFEQSFEVSFTPLAGDESLTPASLVSARLYSSNPDTAQRADSSNALAQAVQSVTTWEDGREVNEKLITFAAVTDPDPTSTEKYEIYYMVYSYRLTSGGTIINDVEPIVIWRADAVTSRYDVSNSDLLAVESKLEELLNARQLENKTLLAETLVDIDLKAKGIEKPRLKQSTARDLVRYRAVTLCCDDLSNDTNDVWAAKRERHAETYKALLENTQLGYDSDDDGVSEPTEVIRGRVGVIWR